MRSIAATLLLTAAAALAAPAVPAAAETPMTYLRAFGEQAADILPLTWGSAAVSVAVVAIVGFLVVLGIVRRYMRGGDFSGGRLPVERSGGGIAWIVVGTGLSTLALLGTMVWTVVTLAAIDEPSREPTLTVEVRGHQWWWEARYLSDDPSRTLITANEIHIPAGEPVRFRLTSADVIHSFWVPALGGKTDLIPGKTNFTWLQADRPGIYRGQCAEYCGRQHAHMILQVYADEPEAFRAWWDAQLQPAPEPDGVEVAEARSLFIVRCGGCHSVRGTLAGGQVGPDLTHLMSRDTIAAGTLPNTIGHLSEWIANPQHVKPGSRMPDPALPGPELARIRSFLLTLH